MQRHELSIVISLFCFPNPHSGYNKIDAGGKFSSFIIYHEEIAGVEWKHLWIQENKNQLVNIPKDENTKKIKIKNDFMNQKKLKCFELPSLAFIVIIFV